MLIQAGEEALLYDGGSPDVSSYVVSYLQKQGIDRLDFVVASHYDADHLAGIIGALNAFEPGILLAPDYAADTYTYDSFCQTVTRRGLTVTHPEAGQSYPFGDGAIQVLAPCSLDYEDENDYSVVLRITLGDTSLLLAGDATTVSEAEMLMGEAVLDSDVLVLGHHGSYSSTGEDFFAAVTPNYAVISCGLGNDYGHPHKRVMALLEETKTPIYRTDLQGTIRFTMTGEEIVFEAAPSEDYSPGDELRTRYRTDSQENKAADNAALLEELSTFPYVLNTNNLRFHLPTCTSVLEMSAQNRQGSNLSREALIEAGYTPCGSCKP